MCSVSGVSRRAVGRESRAQGGQVSAGEDLTDRHAKLLQKVQR